jgi:hypothetical protein
METHANHLHKVPGKKFWHYFFEFFMLFLAVTAGFFVENQRDHYLERQREKEYAKSLYDDLKIDTAVIQRTYDEKAWGNKKMDSLLTILASPDISANSELIYYFERYISFSDPFTSQDVTYQQLKSSGNFRYIGDLELYKSISDYYNLYDRYLVIAESASENSKDLTEMEAKLFNGSDLAGLANPNATIYYNLFNRPEKKLHPVNKDDYYLNYLSVKASNAKFNSYASMVFLAWLKDKATTLITELKNEYHLE